MCQRCDDGYCPLHMGSTRFWLDFNPQWTDWREDELEAREADLSRIDFESPYLDAA